MKSEIATHTVVAICVTVCFLAVSSTLAYNDDRGFQKWSPYWLSNYRYSPPMSYYTATNTRGFPKRLGENGYKWSPRYLAEGVYGRPAAFTKYRMTLDGFDNDDGDVEKSGER